MVILYTYIYFAVGLKKTALDSSCFYYFIIILCVIYHLQIVEIKFSISLLYMKSQMLFELHLTRCQKRL